MADSELESTLPSLEGASRSGGALRDRIRSLQLPVVEEQSGSSGLWYAVAGVVVLVAIGGWYFWQRPDSAAPTSVASNSPVEAKPKPEPLAPQPVKEPAPSITPRRVEPTPSTSGTPKTTSAPRGGIALESKGYIIPAHRIKVSPKVAGMLVELNIEEGMRVKKGEILGVLEKVEYQADLQRAEATLLLAKERHRELKNGNRPEEIQQAEAELAESKAKLKELEADERRARQLIQGGNLTQAEFDQTLAEYNSQLKRIDRLQFALNLSKIGAREERVAQAAAEVGQAEADVMKAKWRLENCTIRAPVTGTILKKGAEEGDIVNPVAFNISASLCDMAALSDLEVELNIQERDIAKVFKGQQCKVRVEAYPDRVYEGYVARLMPIADRAKGAVPVRVKLSVPPAEEGIYLKPDMGAIVSFYGNSVDATSAAANP